MTKSVQNRWVDHRAGRIPARIHTELRSNVRFSIGKKRAVCRLPRNLDPVEKERQIARFERWVIEAFDAKPELCNRFFGKSYQTADRLTVGEQTYRLRIESWSGKSHRAERRGDELVLRLCPDSPENRLAAERSLLSRLVAAHQLPEIEARVHELNARHFNKPIGCVKLKYNHSNWGSCSSKGNINLSTRLLFAPAWVRDYVIIHELAHLIEMNHSPRFWKIVADILPDYKQAERWLKTKGDQCYF